jgi:hypothetical protein
MDDQSDHQGRRRGGAAGQGPVARRSGGRPRAGRRWPHELGFLFANPPLAPGESESDWTSLCDGLADALQPGNIVEWLRLRDVASGVWESLRLERYRDALLRLERGRAAADLLTALLSERIEDATTRDRAARSIARGWLAGRSAEKREMAQALAAAGVDEQTVVAGAFMARLETHERLERLRRRAEEARDAALAGFSAARSLTATSEDTRRRDDIVIDAEVVSPAAPARPRRKSVAARSAAVRAVVEEADARPGRKARNAGPGDDKPAMPPAPQADLFG